MRPGIDLRKGVRDDAVLINDIANPAGKAGVPGAIRLAEHVVGIAEQGERKVTLVGECLICLNGVEACPENLHVVLCKGVVMVTEPVPFGRSTPGVGLGIKPQRHLFAPQL